MVTTGNSDGLLTNSTELIMFDRKHCKNEPKIDPFPMRFDYATGSLVNDSIIICGGADKWNKIHNECYSLSLKTNFAFTFLNNMTKKRYTASSTVIGSRLWITGGCMNDEDSFDDACLNVSPSCRTCKWSNIYFL